MCCLSTPKIFSGGQPYPRVQEAPAAPHRMAHSINRFFIHKSLAYHCRIFVWSHNTPLYFISFSAQTIEVSRTEIPPKGQNRMKRATAELTGANCRCRAAVPAPTTPPCHHCGKRATFPNTKTRPNNQLMFLNNLEHSLQRKEIKKPQKYIFYISLYRFVSLNSIHHSFKIPVGYCSLFLFML